MKGEYHSSPVPATTTSTAAAAGTTTTTTATTALLPGAAAAAAAATTTPWPGHGFGKLLDLTDLDGYLLSLLSADLTDAIKYAFLAKQTIAAAVVATTAASSKKNRGGSHENNNTHENNTHEESATTRTTTTTTTTDLKDASSLPLPRASWWKWEDVLAFVTIWASRGQTPATRALGFRLVEAPADNRPHPPFSLWRWLAGAIGSSSNNNGSSTSASSSQQLWSFRCKIGLYAILRIVLPRLYERAKAKALEYADREEDDDENDDDDEKEEENETGREPPQPLVFGLRPHGSDPLLRIPPTAEPETPRTPSASTANREMRALAVRRRKRVLRMIFRGLDGMNLYMRMVLLLSFWAGHDRSHGGNPSAWWSGLSYAHAPPPPTAAATGTTGSASATTATATATTNAPVPAVYPTLFVAYAHRRWLAKEAKELLVRIGWIWQTVRGDTSSLVSAVAKSLREDLRLRVLRWSYRFAQFRRRLAATRMAARILPAGILRPPADGAGGVGGGDAVVRPVGPCPMCGAKNIVVPYRLSECCGKVVCYVCLWERLAATNRHRIGKRITPEEVESMTFPCPLCHRDIRSCEAV